MFATPCRLAASRLFIVGGHITPFVGKGSPLFIDKNHPDFGKKQNKTLEELMHDTMKGTVASAKLEGKEDLVDYVVVGNFDGELFSSQGHLGPAGIGSLTYGQPDSAVNKLMNKRGMRVEGACASGGLAVVAAADSLRGGTSDIAIAMGVELMTCVSSRVVGDYLARASHYARQRSLDDFTFPCLFARRMKAIVEKGHFTMEDTARVAAKAYANGNKNPLAQMHTKRMSFEQCNSEKGNPKFLNNETFKPYLRMSDCSQVTDGGAGLVLVNETGLAKLGLSVNDPSLVEICGLGLATGNLFVDAEDFTKMSSSHVAAQRAQQQAGIKGTDIHVAEVHDCFSISEILMYEALGLCEYGQGKDLVRNGVTTLEGKYPVNTGGGLLSFGHPVGATGVKQFMEVYRQMKGLCGEYQLKSIPGIGATLNMGGDDKTCVSAVLRNI